MPHSLHYQLQIAGFLRHARTKVVATTIEHQLFGRPALVRASRNRRAMVVMWPCRGALGREYPSLAMLPALAATCGERSIAQWYLLMNIAGRKREGGRKTRRSRICSFESISATLDTYAQVLPRMQDEAVAKEWAIPGGKPRYRSEIL